MQNNELQCKNKNQSRIKQLSSVELANYEIFLLEEKNISLKFGLQRSKLDLAQDCFGYHNPIRNFKTLCCE